MHIRGQSRSCLRTFQRRPLQLPTEQPIPHIANLFTMLRQLTARSTPAIRRFSLTQRAMSDGPNKSDSFKDREAANENVYVKKHEAEQLKKLKEQLERQKKVVEDLSKEIDNLKK